MRSNTGTPFREAVITSDASHLVVPAAEKGTRDCVMVYNAKTGVNISKIPIKLPGFKVHSKNILVYIYISDDNKKLNYNTLLKDIISIVPMPNKAQWVGIIGSDKGSILDIIKKKIIRSIPKWSGNISKDGKYTLYAPSR